MWLLVPFLALLVGSSLGLQETQNLTAHGKVVSCYFGAWSAYRQGRGKFDINDIDPNLCTHLIYSFAGLDGSNHIKSLDPWQDLATGGGKNGYRRAVKLKSRNPRLKVLLAIGGWNEGSTKYSNMVSNAGARRTFVQQTTQFLRKYGFDGLDVDWEYPANRGGKPQDKTNFGLLIKELKGEFRKHNMLVTAAFGTSHRTMDSAYDFATLSQHIDHYHMMCYDYAGPWDRKVGPNAPLHGNGEMSIDWTIDYLLRRGVPSHKIIMGIPLYGRTFIARGEGRIGEPSEGGWQGPYSRQNGIMGYNEMCMTLKDGKHQYRQQWLGPQAENWMQYKQGGRSYVGIYDTQRSMQEKVKFIMSKNLGGAMVWSLDTDDFRGDCKQGRYPLMTALNRAFGVAVEEQEDNDDFYFSPN